MNRATDSLLASTLAHYAPQIAKQAERDLAGWLWMTGYRGARDDREAIVRHIRNQKAQWLRVMRRITPRSEYGTLR